MGPVERTLASPPPLCVPHGLPLLLVCLCRPLFATAAFYSSPRPKDLAKETSSVILTDSPEIHSSAPPARREHAGITHDARRVGGAQRGTHSVRPTTTLAPYSCTKLSCTNLTSLRSDDSTRQGAFSNEAPTSNLSGTQRGRRGACRDSKRRETRGAGDEASDAQHVPPSPRTLHLVPNSY